MTLYINLTMFLLQVPITQRKLFKVQVNALSLETGNQHARAPLNSLPGDKNNTTPISSTYLAEASSPVCYAVDKQFREGYIL
jgi:hypothetical protein